MNRLSTLAIILVLTIPVVGQAQTPEELIKAHEKTAGMSNNWDPEDVLRWSGLNRAGWKAIGKNRFVTAEHEFFAAIDIARKLCSVDKDYRLLARSYADYAYAIQKQGRHLEAEPLVKWALTVREGMLEADSPAIAQTINQLATLYFEVGRFEESEPLLRRAIESQQKAVKPNAQEYARSYTVLGLLMVTEHRYDEAEQPFRRAVEIREKAKGQSHIDTGDALSNLAWVYIQQGKNEDARPLLNRSLTIFERSRGSLDPSVAHTLHGLAKIQSNEGEQEEAEAKFVKAIAIWDHLPVLDASALMEVLRDYSAFLEKLGRAEDLSKIKARMSPLKAKMTLNDRKPAAWYRWPEPSPELDLGVRRIRG